MLRRFAAPGADRHVRRALSHNSGRLTASRRRATAGFSHLMQLGLASAVNLPLPS